MSKSSMLHVIVIGSIALFSASCASRGDAASGAADRTTSEAALVRCADYRRPPQGVGQIRVVQVQFTVMEDGFVDPSSVMLVKRAQVHGDVQSELDRRARSAAGSCYYKPAMRDGQAVPAVVQRTFRFLI